MLEKCKYFNDHRAAAVLMIDDLSLTATTIDGRLNPSCDWGFGLGAKGSLYDYLSQTLLGRYPEIQGTFFYPLLAHAAQNRSAGYKLLFREPDKDFQTFLSESSMHFELAFHGTNHGKFLDSENPSFSNWVHEFELLDLKDVGHLRAELRKSEALLGVKLLGGKYPGYRSGKFGPEILNALGFKWWASSFEMLNKRHIENSHGYLPGPANITNLPTNLSGNCFNRTLDLGGRKPSIFNRARESLRQMKIEAHLQYLYENGFIISIQEHFQNMRTDGLRQMPNIFDDLESLERIYSMLRSGDIWHANCSLIAQYLSSRDRATLRSEVSGKYTLNSNGVDDFLLSLRSRKKFLRNLGTGVTISGRYKSGWWIFNHIEPGTYQVLESNT